MSNLNSLDPLVRDILVNELWTRGELSYKFHSGQDVIERAYNNVTAKLFVSNCSRRFGKTFWGITKAFETAIKKKNARIVIASAFQKDVEEFILPIAQDILTDCPAHLTPKFLASKRKYKFNNGSEIQLVGLDKNPNAGRGKYCDLYIFEEAGYISNLEYLYSSVVMPMTMYREGAKIIMISTPPKSPAHPFRDFCQKAELENAYVLLTIHDNPRVTPEMIETYKKECLSETDWQREYLCSFIVDQNLAIIPEFNPSQIKETTKDEFYPYYHRYVAMDLGFRDFTAVLFGYWDFKRSVLVIQDEHIIKGQYTTDLLSQAIKDKEKQLWPTDKVRLRISDNNNLLLLQDLTTLHDLSFAPTNKDQLEAMVNEVRLLAKNNQIEVDPRCTQLSGCLKYGVWKTNRKEFDRSTGYGHFDALAALIYLVRNLDRNTNPVPITHGITSYDNVWIPQRETSTTEQTLKQIFGIKR